jgi:hypothetical protein
MNDQPDDDDDWFELERKAPSQAIKPAASVTLSKKLGIPTEKDKPARAIIWLRHDAAQWAVENGPRFKAQIGGKNCNKVRLIADAARGQFEIGDFKGVQRLNLGIVNVWPNEDRAATEAIFQIVQGGLVLTLPASFAKTSTNPPPRTTPAEKPSPAANAHIDPRLQRVPAAADDRVLQAALGVTNSFPREIGGEKFSGSEANILEALLKCTEVSREGLMIATHDPSKGEDDRDDKLVDVLLSRMKKRLTAIGVEIQHRYGGNYHLDAASKSRLRTFVEKANAA